MMKGVHSIFLIAIWSAIAQGKSKMRPETIDNIIEPTFLPVNEAAISLFPASIVEAQTPAQIHYTVVTSLATREPYAACDPTALSFFGTKDKIPPLFCKQPRLSIVVAYTRHKLLAVLYPEVASTFGVFLARKGLMPNSRSRNMGTEVGWGNVIGERMANHFRNDGWNVLGDATRSFNRMRFSDITGYTPRNPPSGDTTDLPFPLRWQPLTQSYDSNGNFATQIHVTAHIGQRVRPMSMSQKAFNKKRSPPLYKSPNKFNKIGASDDKLLKKLMQNMLSHNRQMTPHKLAVAKWWDFKFGSLGIFASFYEKKLSLSRRYNAVNAAADALALHDAVVLAWREKRRHDLARPETILRRAMAGKSIKAWRGLKNGVGKIPVEEWLPALRTMPHSEYPSASAIICTAGLEQLGTRLRHRMGDNALIPPFSMVINQLTLDFPVRENVTVRYANLTQAATACGKSRVNAGLHFEPAVRVGERIARGIGEAAYATINSLERGLVPKHCHWCIRN